jgi:SAM-dependent methyltransferase
VSDSSSDIIDAYDRSAGLLARQYDALASTSVLGPWLDLLPAAGRDDVTILDVGAGSGRDGAYLESLGFKVVAAEPAAGMRQEGLARHPELHWIDDRLPDLSAVHRLGLGFNIVLLSAVWMHVAPQDRARAFRKLVTLLKPGGLLLMSLRQGPAPADRPMHPAPVGEVEGLARDHGLSVLRVTNRADVQARPDVSWTLIALQLPDDGSASLPLLRGIILNDDKSSTYKLGLLRAITKIADVAPSVARSRDDGDEVSLPMGLVALNWLRAYLPLIRAELPQTPKNRGVDGLGFAKSGVRNLIALGVTAQELRVGAAFTGDRAAALLAAISDVRRTLIDMPMRFTTWPNSQRPVFASAGRTTRPKGAVVIDEAFLATFGELIVPGALWRTMLRLGSWIDPILVTEWARLTRLYATRQGVDLPPGRVEAEMVWLDPSRDVSIARMAALGLRDRSRPLNCVWSGAALSAETLDIDHALPWSAWPCGDLWNLLPSARRINQHEKRDKLPSAAALSQAQEPIITWWREAWLGNPALSARFQAEARVALPLQASISEEAVFAGMQWRRLRLAQDQMAPEWAGPSINRL